MPPRHPDALPVEALRDLIGVVRAIRVAKCDAGELVVRRIDRVGAELVAAYELAVSCSPGTLGMRAAWARAEEATRQVADLIEMTDGAEAIVQAARERVTQGRSA